MDNSNKDSLSLEMQLILKHKEHNKKCKDYIPKIAEEKILSKEESHNEKIKFAIELAQWYSGMDKEKVEKALNRFQLEKQLK